MSFIGTNMASEAHTEVARTLSLSLAHFGVYWSPTEHPAHAEDKMIEGFKKRTCKLPFANRVRSAQMKNRKAARGTEKP